MLARAGVVLLAGLSIAPAAASAESGAHSLPCATCHVPHFAKTTELWPYDLPPIGGGWYDRPIAKTCYFCHTSGNPYGGSDMTLNAFGNGGSGVHMYRSGLLPKALDGTSLGLPEGTPVRADGSLDCTSCHDVHTGWRPAYRSASVEESCNGCHHRGGATATGDADDTRGRSTHRVDFLYEFSPRVAGEPFPSDYRFTTLGSGRSVSRSFDERLPGTGERWRLGAHLSSGKISCQTCHVVHGAENYEVDRETGARAPFEGLLVAPLIGGALTPESPALRSALCQACHGGGDPGESVRAGLEGPRDHPMGRRRSKLVIDEHRDAGAADPSSARPASEGWSRYWGPQGELVCVTCHDVHGGLGGTALYRSADQTAAGEPQTADNFCETCHADYAPLTHHSHEGNYADSLITCQDCHGAAGSGGFTAHGRFFQRFVTPPAAAVRELPSVSGGPQTVTLEPEKVATNRDSALCGYCHQPGDPSTFALERSPVSGTDLTKALFPASHGARRGRATHQVLRGDNDSIGQKAAQYQSGSQPGAGILFLEKFESGYYAKYGASTGGGNEVPVLGAEPLLICESCHNLIWNIARYYIDNNVGMDSPREELGYRTNLLLELYEDDTSIGGVAVETPDVDGKPTDSTLCVRCHPFSIARGLPHTHGEPDGYLDWGRGLEVTSRELTGWGEATLENVGLSFYPLRSDFPGPLSWRQGYVGWAKFDCDACHRPHNAADSSTMADHVTGDPAPLLTEFAGPIDAATASPTYGNPSMRVEMCDNCHAPKSL